MTTSPLRPPFIVASQDVPEELGRYQHSDEPLAFGRPIGRAAGLVKIGLHLERLPSGQRLSWPHAEEKEEEFVYVLEGEVDAWIDGVLHPMKAGDFAAFPAGTGICHTFINNSTKEATLLAGGEANKPDNRIYYPLHGQRRSEMQAERWWHDVPVKSLGEHDGKPDALREKETK